MQVAIGPTVNGYAPPMVDVNHGPTLLDGCLRRFCRRRASADVTLLKEFKHFVGRWLHANITPVDPTELKTPLQWVDENDNYPGSRKEELRQVFSEFRGSYSDACTEVKGHGKRETYPEYKAARGINSRSDEFKLLYGPLVSALEHVVYAHPAFIKHVPTVDRPKYIYDMFRGHNGKKLVTDYSAFESHFDLDLLKACEFQLYRHGWRLFPKAAKIYCKVLGGYNNCVYKKFSVRVRAKRMSGEMSTSLGNGFTNLMVALFAAHKSGGILTGVVEGDDGLFGCSVPLDTSIFSKLGFNIKIIEVDDVFKSSFCGLMMASDFTSFADPRKTILNFGWSHSPLSSGGKAIRLSLLRAKAMSLLCEHPQCPILCKLAIRALKETEGYQARFDPGWYSGEMKRLASLSRLDECRIMAELGPSQVARREFDELYSIPVSQQLSIEFDILTLPFDSILTGSCVTDLFSGQRDCADYFSRFVLEPGQEWL